MEYDRAVELQLRSIADHLTKDNVRRLKFAMNLPRGISEKIVDGVDLEHLIHNDIVIIKQDKPVTVSLIEGKAQYFLLLLRHIGRSDIATRFNDLSSECFPPYSEPPPPYDDY